MRKHSVRKWLHAILDLLPVIILPIFAIYSHRHTIDSYEVTVPQNEVVNYNQLINYDGMFSTITKNDLTFTRLENGYIRVNGTASADTTVFMSSDGSNIDNYIPYKKDHKYLLRFIDSGSYSTYYASWTLSGSLLNEGSLVSTCTEDNNNGYAYFLAVSGQTFTNFDFYINIFDLTYMFGVGNEPTKEEFSSYYFSQPMPYDIGTKQLLKGVSTVTYDNTDIGSQMMYSLYKPINDYFNLNNVFNFGAIYDWFELNMFNGNAPLSIFIVWNIIVYEFIMDIIFLIYSVFMFVIDFACETLDRFTGWAKRGD